jgi:lysophospholipase L1-like esterase
MEPLQSVLMDRKRPGSAIRWPHALGLCLGAGLFLSSAARLVAEGNARWEFLRTNLDVFPGTDKIFETDSKLFWKLKPNLENVRAAEKLSDGEYRFTISTDRFGRRRMPQPKQSLQTVVFLGDSCTFGIPVSDDETYPALLQQQLRETRCINAGVPGYSAYQGRVLLELWDAAAPPDVVVITFWPNGRSVWDHLSDQEHAELIADEAARRTSSLRLTRLLRRALPGSRPRLSDAEFEGEIRSILQWCRRAGAVPVLQVWPSRVQVEGLDEIDRQQILRRIAAQQKVLLVDLVAAVRARRGAALFTDSIHMTREGYILVAAALRPVIEGALAAAKPRAVSGKAGPAAR